MAGNATVAVTDSASDAVQKAFFVNTVTFTLNLIPAQGAQSLSSSNFFTIKYTHDGAPANLTASSGSLRIQSDLQTSVTISAMSSGSSSFEEWCFQISGGVCQSVSINPVSAGRDVTLYYYDLLLESVSNSVSAGTLPFPPVMTYLTAPSEVSSVGSQTNVNVTLSASPLSVWVTRGSALSVSQTIPGLTGVRWETATSSFAVPTSNPLTVSYYQQYSQNVSYSVAAGTPQNATLSYYSLGKRTNSTLEQIGRTFWIDSNTNATLSSTLGGSNTTERWFIPDSSFLVTGTNALPAILNYSQQFDVTIGVQPAAGGSVGPKSDWFDANERFPINATQNQGWSFQGWSGKGQGSYSGQNPSPTIEIGGPIVESATFYPSILMSASDGGHVSYSYSSAPGVVKSNANETINLPSATMITLTAAPDSIFYTFKGWTGSVNSTSESVTITASSPTTVRATFGYNLFLFGIFGAVGPDCPATGCLACWAAEGRGIGSARWSGTTTRRGS